MTLKYQYINSLVFSAISGLVNIYGIRHFGLVVTNITGHFSEMVQLSGEKNYPILGFIICYILGAFATFSCFLIADKTSKNWIKALPTLINFGIFSCFVLFQNSPIYLLFFAMSSQNSLGINLSNGNIRPSQITGIAISLGDDLAHYFFKINTDKKELNTKFLIKILNMIGFLAGGFLAIFYQKPQILWIVVIFYFIIGVFLLKKQSTENPNIEHLKL